MRCVPVNGSKIPLSEHGFQYLNSQIHDGRIMALKLGGRPAEEVLRGISAWFGTGTKKGCQDLAGLEW
jgi:hypothetical protein